MNTELIKLSRKETIVPKQPLEPKEKAYRSIAKHIFRAHRKHENGKILILLADDIREAEQLAMTAFGTSSVFVKRIDPTTDPQVYEI